jgi:THO complex subunit 4
VSFHKPEGASNAFQKLNGLLVDSRPIKIEIVVGASQADKFIPTAKTLAERTTQPKAKPKSAAADKKKINEAKAKAIGGAKPGQNKKRGRSARPTKKTEAELDSEMADYFVAAPAASNENAPAPAANGEAMDEIM